MTKIEGNGRVSVSSGTQAASATTPVGSDARASSHADSREWLQTRPGECSWISVPAKETNGAYSVVEIISSPGDSTPMHVHQNEEEHFVIVEGTARIAYGDKVFDAPAGTSVTLARNIPHAWGNASNSPLRMVVTCTPGGVEEVLRLMVQGGSDVDIMALANKYGVRVVGPLLLGV
jgi:mannose-6-phosphate isomerase-like protein (cupin superfamily)